jgi:L-histidine N-alpha-methyltransferase
MRDATRLGRAVRGAGTDSFAGDVQYYLSQQPRQLPSRYFYDALGSALFEAICELPWYGVTRAETSLLEAHAPEILSRAGRPAQIVELGSGSGIKLARLIEGVRPMPPNLRVHLVDVSPAALAASIRTLSALDGVSVAAHEATYEVGLLEAMRARGAASRALVLFLGSNIGNFDRPGAEAFLRAVRASLDRGDAFLLGADLVKPERDLLLAYDDPLGVTASFNLNLLRRINDELGGDFRLDRFEHLAVWNEEESRVEMHLISLEAQRVRVAAADLDIAFAQGESIWTESSYKYTEDDVVARLEQTGFELVEQWIENRFALTLVRAA